jgi:hypothetical protein
MVSLVMAWSPFQRANAGIIGVEQPGDYANPIPTTSATGPFGIGTGPLTDTIAGNQIARIYAIWAREKSPFGPL